MTQAETLMNHGDSLQHTTVKYQHFRYVTLVKRLSVCWESICWY